MSTGTVEKIMDRLNAVEQRKDNLITNVEDFFNARRGEPRDVVPVERSQLQNLLRLALSTSSIKEVKLFIRYQMSRHREWSVQNFGQALISAIGEVENDAPEGVKIDLVRLFLGYFVREARYRRPE